MAEVAGIGTIAALSAAETAGNVEAIGLVEEAEEPGEVQNTDEPEQPRKPKNFTITIEIIIISAFIFIAIFTWFEFIRSWYDNVFNTGPGHNFNAVYVRLGYAIFITALALVLIYIVYRIYNPSCDPVLWGYL
jgi:predicted MFS family arabinose efflux permease